jgi:hypothetical protein
LLDDLTPAQWLWSAAGLLMLLAAVAAWAEHRRTRRRNLDRPGWVPWNLVQVLAFLCAVIAVALAIKL